MLRDIQGDAMEIHAPYLSQFETKKPRFVHIMGLFSCQRTAFMGGIDYRAGVYGVIGTEYDDERYFIHKTLGNLLSSEIADGRVT